MRLSVERAKELEIDHPQNSCKKKSRAKDQDGWLLLYIKPVSGWFF